MLSLLHVLHSGEAQFESKPPASTNWAVELTKYLTPNYMQRLYQGNTQIVKSQNWFIVHINKRPLSLKKNHL